MSGYLEGMLVLLAVNVVFAYSAYLPLAVGQLNIGLAGFAAVGAYSSAYLSNTFGLNPVIAICIGGAAASLLALVVAYPVLQTRGIYLALATFALGQVVQATILNLEVVGGAAGYPVAAYIRLPVVISFAMVIAAFVWLLFGTRFGLAVTAVRDDENVADLMGIEVRGVQIAAFIEAQYFSIGLSITIVLYVILGGTQTVAGPLVGAAIFTLLPELFRASAHWRYVLFAAGIIVLMALRPQGLVTGVQLRRLFDWRSPLDRGFDSRAERDA
jgi:branched-chain amino acid transport system permease protein